MTTTEKPLWQMDVRHRLGLEPGSTDPISTLLFGAIYGSCDEAELVERIENHVTELMKTLAILREGKPVRLPPAFANAFKEL